VIALSIAIGSFTATPPRDGGVIITENASALVNPNGVKGVGEGGIPGASGAIPNAVAGALGVPVTELPLTPERVLRLVQKSPYLDQAS
jgi:CO/xanthine dehydrogenase Mo-binding subunit